MQRACLESQTGPVYSSRPFEKEDEVFVKFPDGLVWSVPHLVPADLKADGGLPAAPKTPKMQKQKPKPKATQKAEKPVEDYAYPIIRCKYCTQGSKSPLIKVEAREDRHDLHSRWVQKVQLVVKDGHAAKAMNVAKCLCDCYVYMNLNPSQLNFHGCRDSLLSLSHDWTSSPLDWQAVNKLRLKHCPESQFELYV